MAYPTPSSFYRVTELSLTNNEGKKISIREAFLNLSYTEDIYQNFMHGSITITDSIDIHQFFPVIGEEIITFSYTTDENLREGITLKFRVYRVESGNSEQERIHHTFFFASQEAFTATNMSISRAWKGKSPSIIVNDVFKQISTKPLSIGNFSGRHHIVSPNWSPLQTINYVASISTPKSYKGSLVLFYENSRGYNFKHIEELIDSPSIGQWEVGLSQTEKENQPINPSNFIQSYKILKNSADNLDSIFSGTYSNMSFSYDNVTKTYKKNIFNYVDEFKNSKHLNLFPLVSNNFTENSPEQKILYFPANNHREQSNYYRINSDSMQSFDKKEIISSWRTSLISQISAKQIELELNGDESVVAGSVMNIVMPNISKSVIDNHRYNTKKVLVTKVVHAFNITEHKKVVIVTDDSYSDELTSRGFNAN